MKWINVLLVLVAVVLMSTAKPTGPITREVGDGYTLLGMDISAAAPRVLTVVYNGDTLINGVYVPAGDKIFVPVPLDKWRTMTTSKGLTIQCYGVEETDYIMTKQIP